MPITQTSPIYTPTLDEFIAIVKTKGIARNNKFVASFFPNNAFVKDANISGGTIRDMMTMCESIQFPTKTINTRDLRINSLTEKRANTLEYGNKLTATFIIDNSWNIRYFFELWMQYCIGGASFGNNANNFLGREVEFYDNYTGALQIFATAPFSNAPPPPPISSGLSKSLISGATALITSTANTATALIKGNILGKSISGIVQQGVGVLASSLTSPTAPNPNSTSTLAEIPTYSLYFFECFPIEISEQSMSSTILNDVHRLTVTFAYKYYLPFAVQINNKI